MPDDEEKKDEKSSEGDEKSGSRMDAAKAFFRAMYAGEEPANSPSGEQGGGDDSRRVKELQQQILMLEQKVADAENLYKRMAADFDNFRRRTEREREESTNAGVRKLAEALIPALDDLDRAQMYLNKDTPAEKVLESFQLVATRISQCLDSAGLKRLNTKGGVMFDPRFHEPVQQIESELPDQTILHELRGGYMLGERVIRPALVNVALNNNLVMPPVAELNQSVEASPKEASVPETVTAEVVSTPPAEATPPEAPKVTEAKKEEELTKAASKTATGETEDGSRVFDLGDMDDIT